MNREKKRDDAIAAVQSALQGNAHEAAEKLFGITFKQKRGGNRTAHCPLHNETHGYSFSMRDDGIWYCFGKCSRGGTMTDLVRELLGESHPLAFLARYFHVYN
jgi:hypothetical protein